MAKLGRSAGAQAIVAEAMRTDTNLPLYATFGAGLTELASAYLIEPRIADRLTAIWIGGPEYAGMAEPPPGSQGIEYNLNIDVKAAQVVFNDSAIRLWQVPRNAYRRCLLELLADVRPRGKVGAYLHENHNAPQIPLTDVRISVGQVTRVVGATLSTVGCPAHADAPVPLVTPRRSRTVPRPHRPAARTVGSRGTETAAAAGSRASSGRSGDRR